MKRILVLQQPSSVSPVDHWLLAETSEIEIVVITGVDSKRQPFEYAPGVHVISMNDYRSEETTAQIMNTTKEWKPHCILSNSEQDVQRAATARSTYGIESTNADFALLFRDKLRMKELFEQAGVRAVNYTDSQSVDGLRQALKIHGTIVIKPRFGTGSQKVRVVRSMDELASILSSDHAFLNKLHSHQLIVEEFIDGVVYHVDALIRVS